MRLLLALLVATSAAGCFSARDAAESGDDDLPFEVCAFDTDCVLAGPSCCECPTYATSVTSGWLDICGNVDCTPPTDGSCAPLVARCDRGACVAECAPQACDLSCPTGFAVDATGCVTCACAGSSPPPQCAIDDDCVAVPADCCGCARGGRDTAVPRAEAESYLGGLGCPLDASEVPCPDVSTCDAAAVPRCVTGQCQLGVTSQAPPQLPPGACGRPELPPCPADQLCVINQDPDANPLGVGVCTPSMP